VQGTDPKQLSIPQILVAGVCCDPHASSNVGAMDLTIAAAKPERRVAADPEPLDSIGEGNVLREASKWKGGLTEVLSTGIVKRLSKSEARVPRVCNSQTDPSSRMLSRYGIDCG
jgi:hypothetical protein